jgi:general secretion pathway protein K
MIVADRRRGIVLVAVLWSVALLSALAMAASVSFRSFAGIVAVGRDRVQGEALLTAGLEVAAGIVSGADDRPLSDVETTVTLSTGTVRARLSDEGGRIDLGKAPVEVLAAMLRTVGAPTQQADVVAKSIVLGRRRDTMGRAITSAPSGNEAGKVLLDHPYADVQELTHVPGVTPGWIAAMRPLVTVYGTETINPLTAPAGVIAALPGVDRERLAIFLATRRQSPTDAERVSSVLGSAQRYLAAKRQQIVSMELVAVLPDGYTTAARAVVAVLPQDSQPYRVLVWKPLPPSTLR